MKYKLLIIVSSIIVAVVLIATICLSTIKKNVGLKIANPSYFMIYKNSTVGTSYNLKDSKLTYNKLLFAYREMTNYSIFDLLSNNINKNVGQDEKSLNPWSAYNYINFYCLEIVFNDKQSVIININGNTKKIDYFSLMIIIENNSKPTDTYIYFSSTANNAYISSSKSYPFIVTATTSTLFSIIKNL